jgi:hypothetical protein
MGEDHGEQCHYSPSASIFTHGVIALRQQITVVGDTRWEQTTYHCHTFSDIAIQLLHDLGAIFHPWILMPPPRAQAMVAALFRPTPTMGKVVNVTTIYEEWLKEVKVDLTTNSRRAGDTVPSVLLNFPVHILAPKIGRGNICGTNERHTTRNDTRQGRASAQTVLDRTGGE